MVLASGGMPFDRSIFGKRRGSNRCVMSQFSTLTARSLAGTSDKTPNTISTGKPA